MLSKSISAGFPSSSKIPYYISILDGIYRIYLLSLKVRWFFARSASGWFLSDTIGMYLDQPLPFCAGNAQLESQEVCPKKHPQTEVFGTQKHNKNTLSVGFFYVCIVKVFDSFTTMKGPFFKTFGSFGSGCHLMKMSVKDSISIHIPIPRAEFFGSGGDPGSLPSVL